MLCFSFSFVSVSNFCLPVVLVVLIEHTESERFCEGIRCSCSVEILRDFKTMDVTLLVLIL